MFAKPVKEHNHVSRLQTQQFLKSNHSNAPPLKPSQFSALNTARTTWQNPQNPLKRTSPQADQVERPIKHNKAIAKTPAMLGNSSAGERLGKLHGNVWFDENDFDDDNNIILDDDDAPVNTATQEFPQPSPSLLPPATARISPRTPASSLTIPWSSSPPEHHHAPRLGAQAIAAPPEKAAKRRKLPWSTEQFSGKVDAAFAPADLSHRGQEETEKPRQVKAEKGHSPYPWNKTASAIKEEQKRHRQGHKRQIMSIDAKDGPRKSKQKESLAKVFLSDEQRLVMKMVSEDTKSVFFTGSAGTGKSVLLREIIQELHRKYKREPDRVAVTASTGLAACNIGGVTLHSFAGIGLGKEPAFELVRKVKKNQKAKQRWLRTKVLIIDEISMVDGDLFDKLEEVARAIRNNGRPFGGIQLVITGDFFQLPPVPDGSRAAKFSFDAATWNTSIEHTIGLTNIFRQKDPVFANMLNEMRLGKLTAESIDCFRSLSRPLASKDDFQATELFPTRIEVDNANSARMRNLGGHEIEFTATDGGSIVDKFQRDKLLSNCMAPPVITLKKGAQVMLIKNLDAVLVNGSVGRVMAFMDEKNFDHYMEHEDAYQAIENYDSGDDPADGEVNPSRLKLRQLTKGDATTSTSRRWPLVRFTLPDGSVRELLCQPEQWSVELPNGEVQASRTQVPLILAWALSIHKAQGQTLARVKVDMGKIFEKGQAYVALSRATTQEGLQVIRFDPKKVMAHDRVRTFYDGLYAVEQATGMSST